MPNRLFHKGLPLLCAAAVLSACGVQQAVTGRTDSDSIDLGYGSAKRGSNVYSVSEVQISEAEENTYNDIFGYLRNHVPGVEVSPDAGAGGVPHVRVLKDAAASAYGSRGANGVILITTKVAHEAAERERENKQNR